VLIAFGDLADWNFSGTTGVLNHVAGDFSNQRGHAGQNGSREAHLGSLVPAHESRQEHVL
jgi:hypothetical protein